MFEKKPVSVWNSIAVSCVVLSYFMFEKENPFDSIYARHSCSQTHTVLYSSLSLFLSPALSLSFSLSLSLPLPLSPFLCIVDITSSFLSHVLSLSCIPI